MVVAVYTPGRQYLNNALLQYSSTDLDSSLWFSCLLTELTFGAHGDAFVFLLDALLNLSSFI
jgi:hypothetical protein